MGQQVGGIPVDGDAAGGPEVGFGEAPAEDANGAEADPGGGLGVVWGVTDDEGVRRVEIAKFLQDGAENIRVGLGAFDVGGVGLHVRDVLDLGNLLVGLHDVVFTGGGEGDLLALLLDAFEDFSGLGERLDLV